MLAQTYFQGAEQTYRTQLSECAQISDFITYKQYNLYNSILYILKGIRTVYVLKLL